jgi:cytochrome c-type biogenesis protein CcmH
VRPGGLVAAVFGLCLGGFTLEAQAPSAVSRTQSASTADSALEARTSAVAGELRCPVCQGVSIQDSPSELALQMRGVVRDQLRTGRTPEQVKAYFVSKYGEWILLEPKPRGVNLLVYWLPAAVVLGGLGVVFFAVRRWTRQPESPGQAAE